MVEDSYPSSMQPRTKTSFALLVILFPLVSIGRAVPVTDREHTAAHRYLVVRRAIAPVVRLPDGTRLWTWPDGGLVVTDTNLTVVRGESLLSLPCSPDLRGTSRGRRLLSQNGRYPVDGTLLLSDRGITALVARGRLVITPDSLVIDAGKPPPPQAAQLLLLAGIALLTFALVLRSRSRLRTGRT